MRKLVAFAALMAAQVILSGPSLGTSAQEGADPRAFEACQVAGATFVQIEACLPNAHVSFQVLDAFEQIYPTAALPIKSKCIDLNTTILGASICLLGAIDAAISLSATMPAGASLPDPVFNSVKDADLRERLKATEQEARKLFPKQRSWGGGLYTSYR